MARAEGLGLAVFAVLLCMNLWAASLVQQGSYDAAQEAADLDPYEWADHKLSYVYSASAESDLPAGMQETLERYMADLEKLNSNSVPKYLARSYFNLKNINKGFAMLEKFVDYTPSNPGTWEESFRIAMEYDDGSEAFAQGVQALEQRLEQWNAENLGTIQLPEDVVSYLNGAAD